MNKEVQHARALTRRSGESIIISLSETADPSMTLGELFAKGQIEITIGDISKNQVTVGIDAPLEFQVMRDELVYSEL